MILAIHILLYITTGTLYVKLSISCRNIIFVLELGDFNNSGYAFGLIMGDICFYSGLMGQLGNGFFFMEVKK